MALRPEELIQISLNPGVRILQKRSNQEFPVSCRGVGTTGLFHDSDFFKQLIYNPLIHF